MPASPGGLRFAKLRAEERSFIVVNSMDSVGRESKHVAVAVCSPTSGLVGDRLAIITHRGRGRFELRGFAPNGAPAEPDATLAACAAVAVHRRYGYREVSLRDAGHDHDARITGDSVRVRTTSRATGGPAGEIESHIHVAYLFDGEFRNW
ncbi:MAG: hypothetical protein HOY78_34235 [Saccharothrix sp.]|nr:hypothetical protein [Saccharothrix sp.]